MAKRDYLDDFRKVRDFCWPYSGAFIAAGVGVVLFLFPVGGGLERASFDVPFAWRSEIAEDRAVIIYLDEESHQELNQPYGAPWDRSLHARLLERLKADGARLVVFDILFDQPLEHSPEVDARFAQALANHGQVVLAADYTVSKSVQGVVTSKATLPAPRFQAASAGWGNVKLLCDPDFGIREHFPNLRSVAGHENFPSLPWAAAELIGVEVTRELDAKKFRRYVNYYGPPGTLPSVSYFLNFVEEAVPPDFYRDKIVFIGAQLSVDYSGKGKDEFATPYSRWHQGFAPGVEVHATMFLNLLRGDWLRRLPWGLELALLLASGCSFGGCFMRVRPLAAAGLALISAGAITAAACVLVWYFHRWWAWGILVAQIPVALGWGLMFQLIRARIEQAALKRSLSLHLSAHRVEQILRNQDILKPGAEEREVSILFSDIANFSKIMQRGLLGQMVPLLNDYFEAAIGCVHERDGTVVKLIGDAIFAIWNAPELQAKHADLACQAALLLRRELLEFDRQHRTEFSFRTRVGLHTEKVFVGNFGSRQRFDYTAIGNGVNLASRLEGANKILGTETLVSDELASRLKERYVFRNLGQLRFKGFDEIVIVHELVGGPELEEATRAWRESFQNALAHFKQQHFKTAEAAFRTTIELRRKFDLLNSALAVDDIPDDGPSCFYLKNLQHLLTAPPPKDWMGEVALEEK